MTKRILFCSTDYHLSTGYAKTGYEILKYLCKNNFKVWHLAFQSYNKDVVEREPIKGLTVLRDEKFGTENLLKHIADVCPDIVVLYNDVIVGANYTNELLKLEQRNFKFYHYIDLTYKYQNFIEHISKVCDKFICFHEEWERHLVEDMGIPSGRVTSIHHPPIEDPGTFDITECRENFKFKENDFVILNLNRNSYRKLLDITIDGFIRFFKKHGCSPHLKLFLGCKFEYNGSYDIHNICKIFSKIHKLSEKEILILLDTCIMRFPRDNVSDETVRQLYAACDVGINTCGGEGYGLCTLEHAMYGRPQIVTQLDNFKVFFNENQIHYLKPVNQLIIPSELDIVGGLLEIPSAQDVCDELSKIYKNNYKICPLNFQKRNFTKWSEVLNV